MIQTQDKQTRYAQEPLPAKMVIHPNHPPTLSMQNNSTQAYEQGSTNNNACACHVGDPCRCDKMAFRSKHAVDEVLVLCYCHCSSCACNNEDDTSQVQYMMTWQTDTALTLSPCREAFAALCVPAKFKIPGTRLAMLRAFNVVALLSLLTYPGTAASSVLSMSCCSPPCQLHICFLLAVALRLPAIFKEVIKAPAAKMQ